jgi:hypothetical protein
MRCGIGDSGSEEELAVAELFDVLGVSLVGEGPE